MATLTILKESTLALHRGIDFLTLEHNLNPRGATVKVGMDLRFCDPRSFSYFRGLCSMSQLQGYLSKGKSEASKQSSLTKKVPVPKKPTTSSTNSPSIDQMVEPTPAIGMARWLNILVLFAVVAVISGSIVQEFGYGMAPSALGIVVRSALVGVAFGAILNLFFGMRPQHYAFVLFSALVGSGAAASLWVQTSSGTLSLDPNEIVFGHPLYEWAVGAFAVAFLGCAIMLCWPRSLDPTDVGLIGRKTPSRLITLTFVIWLSTYMALTIYQVLRNCGVTMCPADPISTGPQNIVFTFSLYRSGDETASISIPGFITVMLGIGVGSLITAAFVNHFLGREKSTATTESSSVNPT